MDFYESIIAARRKARDTLSEEDISALKVRIEIKGRNRIRKRKSKRKRTTYNSIHNFTKLENLKRFLQITGEKYKGLDWSKQGLCQYEKSAKLYVSGSGRRIKDRTLKRFKLES
jgi:hypothetical protein